MNASHDDQRIAAEFDRLRQAEYGHAPRFSGLLANGGQNQRRPGLPGPVFGVALMMLFIAVFTLLYRGQQDAAPDTLDDLQYTVDAQQLSTVDEMPTDFLLDMPWPQLASLDPGPQLLDPPYDFLEDLPDEP